MMEEDFYASIKLVTGEEIFAKISPSEENGNLYVLLLDPIIINEVKTRHGYAYKVEPWMKTTKDDVFVIKFESIITITETNDEEMILIYEKFVKQKNKDDMQLGVNHFELTKDMGYISNIREAIETLEKLFKEY